MKKRISITVALTFLLVTMSAIFNFGVSAEVTETIPQMFTEAATKGMINGASFGPNYTFTAASPSGVTVAGSASRGAYERVDVRGQWNVDGLRIEMKNVSGAASILACFGGAVGAFPADATCLGIGFDPTSNNLWVTNNGAQSAAPATEAFAPMATKGTPAGYRTASSTYTIQFNKQDSNWMVTVDDCAYYLIPNAPFGTIDTAAAYLSFVSNPAAVAVTYTVSSIKEGISTPAIPNLKTVPKKGETDKGAVNTVTYGQCYALTDNSAGGVDIVADPFYKAEHRVDIVGTFSFDGLRLEFTNVDSPLPIVVSLGQATGAYPIWQPCLSFFTPKVPDWDAQNKLYVKYSAGDGVQKPNDTEVGRDCVGSTAYGAGYIDAARKSNKYTIQFNKISADNWLVTIDDVAFYYVPNDLFETYAKGTSGSITLANWASGSKVSFTLSAIYENCAALDVPSTVYTPDNGTTTTTKGESSTTTNNASPPKTGEGSLVTFALLSSAAALICIKKVRK